MNIEIFPESDLDLGLLLISTNQMIYSQQYLMDTGSKVQVQAGKEIEPKKLGLFFLLFFLKPFIPTSRIQGLPDSYPRPEVSLVSLL
jgi:hypothetical protein